MAFIKSALKLILREHQTYRYEGPVLALGVPEVYATEAELNEWSKEWLDGRRFPDSKLPGMASTNAVGRELQWVSAKAFFAGLGLDDVTYMDIPGSEHPPDLVHDLNQPLPADRLDKYRLVMDPGTIEHVFDMKMCLTNVVRALQIGGIVVHQVPVYMFNGGYYSINPNVLNDFYARNGFTDLRTFIVMWDRYHPYKGQSRCYEYTASTMGARHALADVDQVRYSPMMVFFARKQEEVAEIRSPLQFDGNYFTRSEGPDASPPAAPALTPAGRARALIRAAVNVLPGGLPDTMNGHFTRIGALARTRKHSFWI